MSVPRTGAPSTVAAIATIIETLARSIHTCWEAGDIAKRSARTRAEIRMTERISTLAEVLDTLTGYGQTNIELLVTDACRTTGPRPNGTGYYSDLVSAVMEQMGYGGGHADRTAARAAG